LAGWKEIPVFIHGITPGRVPGPHTEDYEALLTLVDGALVREGKAAFTAEPLMVEWGWLDGGRNTWPDKDLALAEILVHDACEQAEAGATDFTLNPLRPVYSRLRDAFLYGFADIFYYVSADGEATLRDHVFGALAQRVAAEAASGEGVSLTFFAHSAGTVIAQDFLYHLFAGAGHAPHPEVRALRESLPPGAVRVRRFYTLGSPITPLFFRANSLVRKAIAGQRLDPADLGLGPDPMLGDPRWVNFWDKDDLFAYPLAFHFATPGGRKAVEDRYVDVGDVFPSVHGAYWRSEEVAASIARTF
jgi:hypothetical protein